MMMMLPDRQFAHLQPLSVRLAGRPACMSKINCPSLHLSTLAVVAKALPNHRARAGVTRPPSSRHRKSSTTL